MRNTLLLILIVTSLSGCASKSDNEGPAASHQKTIDQNIKTASERWMTDGNINDFQFLRAQLPPGVSVHQVELLLGDPHGSTQDGQQEFYEYIAKDHTNKKTDNWSAAFDEKGTLISWAHNGP
jgi:outer membrane protein assembly factor BamE (lipoprotein component of BamABCDE complex)